MNLLDEVFKIMNGSEWKGMTPYINSTFKGEEEKNTSHMLTINFIIFTKLKKKWCILGYKCITLTIKLELRQAIKKSIGDKFFTIRSIGKTPREYDLGKIQLRQEVQNRLKRNNLSCTPPSSTKYWQCWKSINQGALPYVKSQLDLTPFRVGAPSGVLAQAP